MLPASALQSMNVLWATPCYISPVSMNYVTSMFELERAGSDPRREAPYFTYLWKSGLRFSMNARTPSFDSSDS